jgi:hypothetical protein
MGKIVKKYEEFVYGSESKPAPTTTPAPTITPKPARPMRPSVIPTERPSVQDDPLAGYKDGLSYLHDKLEGSELYNNILTYKGYEIEQPSETGNYVVDGVDLKTNDVYAVIKYVNIEKKYNESKSYKTTRKFGK